VQIKVFIGNVQKKDLDQWTFGFMTVACPQWNFRKTEFYGIKRLKNIGTPLLMIKCKLRETHTFQDRTETFSHTFIPQTNIVIL